MAVYKITSIENGRAYKPEYKEFKSKVEARAYASKRALSLSAYSETKRKVTHVVLLYQEHKAYYIYLYNSQLRDHATLNLKLLPNPFPFFSHILPT